MLKKHSYENKCYKFSKIISQSDEENRGFQDGGGDKWKLH